jgi:hypothetical protein
MPEIWARSATRGTSTDRAGLVIGYGRPAEHACTTALARLCAILER